MRWGEKTDRMASVAVSPASARPMLRTVCVPLDLALGDVSTMGQLTSVISVQVRTIGWSAHCFDIDQYLCVGYLCSCSFNKSTK